MNKVLCELCYPESKEYGELIPGFWLVETVPGKFALVGDPNGHKGCELFLFPEKPYPDPDPNYEHEDNKEITEAAGKWIDLVCEWSKTIKLYPEDGYSLYCAAKEKGWDRSKDSFLMNWLFHMAGLLLQEKENEVSKVQSICLG
jgi:hypothetical protein